MARLNVVDPGSASGKVKEIFDGPLKGKHINIFKGMANSPAALQAYLGMAGALNASMLTTGEREAIALTLAQLNDCKYCRAAHTALAKGAGLDLDTTVAIRKGTVADPKLAALRKFVVAIHEKKGFVTDAQLGEIRKAGYTDGHIAEITAVYALNIYTNVFNHVNDTTVDFPTPPVI